MWKQVKNCSVGDIVYVYVGRPYSKLFYKCLVTQADIILSDSEMQKHNYLRNENKDRKYMTLEMKSTLNVEGLDLQSLFAHGLKTVQCSTEINESLESYIKRILKEGGY
jgi:hypothetical protein